MKTENRKRAPLSAGMRKRLTALVRALGAPALHDAIGGSRETLARALAGLTLNPSTRALVERVVGELEERGAA